MLQEIIHTGKLVINLVAGTGSGYYAWILYIAIRSIKPLTKCNLSLRK